jgi:hypothetical protein
MSSAASAAIFTNGLRRALPSCVLSGGAIATGMFASIRRNRDGLGWFALALVITPILAFFFCTILRERASGDPPEAPLALGAFLLAIFMVLVFAFFFTHDAGHIY